MVEYGLADGSGRVLCLEDLNASSATEVAGENTRCFGTMAKNGTEGCDDVACCGPRNGQKRSDIDPKNEERAHIIPVDVPLPTWRSS